MSEVMLWFRNSLSLVFQVLKDTKIDNNGFSYLSFLIFIAFVRIIIGLANYIRSVEYTEAQDDRFLNLMIQHDEYKDYNNWLKRNRRK